MDGNGPADPPSSTNAEPQVSLEVLPLHSTTLLTVLDENGTVRYESPAIERIYGFDQDELVGEQVADYVHSEDRDVVVAAFRAVVTGDDHVEAVEYRHERADGTYTWVESVASANPTPDGNYVINTRDVSAQKERERQLEATNERLDEFASVVSHDLRNPLNIAQGRAAFLADDCESDHLEAVERAHDRIDALIDDLLTLSRVGERASQTESIALAALAETCWRTVPTADATLVTETDRNLPADRRRLRQLLENLFRNSVEHSSTSSRDPTEPGESVERGSTSSRTSPDDSVEHGGRSVTVTVGGLDGGFYVEDDGSGIPEADRENVFTVGYSTADEGTGFGLRIVKQVAEAHGWDVRVTDGTEGGARFEFTGVPTTDG
ncbi:sensor histidine kinase [Halorubrum rubrum]|uniref:histidine kinase n=1 Tax=Halorubrum rubrum TaxID=1126240 RepID=A0ABD5R2G7_9EURY|nr:PAS domain-containing sensor histidine kinase [Halorubrum rubrum]